MSATAAVRASAAAWRRRARLASLPAGGLVLAAEGAVRRLAGQDPRAVRADLRQRNAERTRRVLGELKGGALKAGQLLSTVEALLPQDPDAAWSRAVSALQERNPGVPFAELEPVLRAELGPRWRDRLRDLEEDALAAASLGQVHAATWEDGRRVAVKVQYPGVREALRTDVRTVAAMSRVAAVVAPGLALPPLVAELRDRLLEELDYLREARVQRAFAEAYAGDPDVHVPSVVEATPRVLVQDLVAGTPLADVARGGDGATRDAAALRYQLALVSGPERAGWLHTDPHPGNFRVLDDGRLAVLDFGSALPMPDGMPRTFGALIRALADGDAATVGARLRDGGFLRPDRRVDVEALRDVMAPFSEPARHDVFTFSRAWLRTQFGRVNDPRNPDLAVAMQLTLPAEHLFTHRVWLGMVGVLCQLEATIPVRPVLERWLPGFAEG